MKPLRLLVLILIIHQLSISNGNAQWQQTNGPYGGYASCIAANANAIFCGGEGGIFRSTDNGANWNRVLTGPAAGTVYSIAATDSEIFAGTINGIFISRDNGDTWVQSDSGLNHYATNNWAYSFLINGANIFAGTYAGVYLSVNGGFSWTKMNTQYTEDIYSLAMKGDTMFAGTYNGGILFSPDSGNTWAQLNSFGYDVTVNALLVNGNNIFAATNSEGIFLSTDNGNSWAAVNNGLPNTVITSLALSGPYIYAGIDFAGALARSADNGATWTPVNNGLPYSWVEAILTKGPDIFVCNGTSGIFLSTDSGDSWTAVNNGFTANNIFRIVTSGPDIYASSNGNGVYLSDNSGSSWTQIDTGLPANNYPVYALAITPYHKIFASCDVNNSVLYSSVDNGNTWVESDSGIPSYMVIEAMAVSGGNIYAGAGVNYTGGVYLSVDSGVSWKSITGDMADTDVIALAVTSRGIFAATFISGHAYFSADTGKHWSVIDTGATSGVILSLAGCGPNMVAGRTDGVAISANNGQTWTLTDTFTTYTRALAVSGDTIFAGGIGLSYSIDYGATWAKLDSGLPTDFLHQLYSLAFGGSYLYAGTNSAGVWRLPVAVATCHITPPVITAVDSAICPGDSSLLTVSGSYSTYLWNTGATTPTIYASSSGSYYVQVTDSNGCMAVSDTVPISTWPTFGPEIIVQGDTLTAYGEIGYQWYFNDSIIPGANSPVYVVTTSGYYAVLLTDTHGCTTRTYDMYIVVSGVNNLTGDENISLYPNPSTGTWQLSVGDELVGSALEIFDDEGRLVFKSEIRNLQSQINLEVPSGVYYLRIVGADPRVSPVVRKLVKM